MSYHISDEYTFPFGHENAFKDKTPSRLTQCSISWWDLLIAILTVVTANGPRLPEINFCMWWKYCSINKPTHLPVLPFSVMVLNVHFLTYKCTTCRDKSYGSNLFEAISPATLSLATGKSENGKTYGQANAECKLLFFPTLYEQLSCGEKLIRALFCPQLTRPQISQSFSRKEKSVRPTRTL